MPRHGTWTETGGGGETALEAVAVILIAIVLCGGAGGAAAVLANAIEGLLLDALIAVAVLVGVTIPLAAWWFFRIRPARKARDVAAYAARVEAYEDGKRRRALELHQQRLEIARASAPQISIDPSLVAATLRQYQPQPVNVIRGEVER
jgi:hypothetical protein